MEAEVINGIRILDHVWLAEVKAEALIGDERSTDVLKLLDSYELVVQALRESKKREQRYNAVFKY